MRGLSKESRIGGDGFVKKRKIVEFVGGRNGELVGREDSWG